MRFLLVMVLFAGASSGVAAERLAIRTTVEREGRVSRGTYRVFEDRAHEQGRMIALEVVVLRARDRRRADPVVVLAGGPGQNAAAIAPGFADSWMREERDLVFVSQRGTAGDHRLDVAVAGDDRDLQGYLAPIFDEERFRAAMERLAARADLRSYSTPIAADDLDEALTALGYGRVDLMGGSYGTRFALVFMRRHAERVRAAILNGVAPLAFRNPLFHARAAQEGIERIFEEVERDGAARSVYPRLREKFAAILARLERAPVSVRARHPGTGEQQTVTLDRSAFGEAVRVLMYGEEMNRKLPALIEDAYAGRYEAFAQRAIESNRALRRQLAFGMLMCVTAAEDLARIDPDEIDAATRGTFLGDARVRQQLAVGAFWPRSSLPPDYGDPVSVDVPVLLISGTHDPVTPPEWGEEAARHLKNSLHLVLPGAHGVHGPGLDRVERQFLDDASVDGLDLSPLEGMRMAPIELVRSPSRRVAVHDERHRDRLSRP